MQYQPLLPDKYFHIYNRGNNGENIFIENKNYQYFLQLITRHILPVCDILAYCLLKNHFHLLIRTKNFRDGKSISKAFSNLFNSYAKAVNKSYNRTGSLFQDRFKRIQVTEESYLINLALYIHLNPEHHGMVTDFKDYKHSSYLDYLGRMPSLVEKEPVLSLFDSVDNFVAIHETKRLRGVDLKFDIEN